MLTSAERRTMIDRLLSERDFVGLDELKAVLGVSAPTIKRDLRYMRETLLAPVVYSRARRAYHYEDGAGAARAAARIPAVVRAQRTWYTGEELYALVSAHTLLEGLGRDADSLLTDDIEPILARVRELLARGGMPPGELLRRTLLVERGAKHESTPLFGVVGLAIAKKQRLRIAYVSRRGERKRPRVVSPARLVHYKNRWYLDAYCHKVDAWRTFSMENIKGAHPTGEASRSTTPEEVARRLDPGYGLFRGAVLKKAVLLFDETAKPFVKQECWHPRQRQARVKKSLRLTVPYSDSTELVSAILSWGPHVKVLAPEELREEVLKRLHETLQGYE